MSSTADSTALRLAASPGFPSFLKTSAAPMQPAAKEKARWKAPTKNRQRTQARATRRGSVEEYLRRPRMSGEEEEEEVALGGLQAGGCTKLFPRASAFGAEEDGSKALRNC